MCFPNANLIDAEGQFLRHYDDVLDLPYPRASDRFIQLLTRIALAHQHLGLIRMSALRQTRLHASFIAADINFLAELSLYGKFHNLREYLLFRRLHPGSSSWDRANRSRQVVWSDPTRGRRIRLDRWEATWHFVRSVRRSPVPWREKLAMYRYLLRRTIRQRDILGRDLLRSGRELGRRLFGR